MAKFRPEKMHAWTGVANTGGNGNCVEEEQVGPSESLGGEREKYKVTSGSQK